MESERKIVKRRLHIVIAMLVLIGVGVGIKFGRYYVVAKRFAVVEPGRIYRGGEQQAGPYRRIIEENGIRTVLTLLDERKDDQREKVEAELIETQGLLRIRIPMPGDGLADFDDLDRAAAILADGENQSAARAAASAVNQTQAELDQPWDQVSAEPKISAGVRIGSDLRIVSVGTATREGERVVRIPLVLGNADGESVTLAISIQLDPLLDDDVS